MKDYDSFQQKMLDRVVYPMFEALQTHIVPNIQAVEPFWEEKWAEEGASVSQQNQRMVQAYFDSLILYLRQMTCLPTSQSQAVEFDGQTAGPTGDPENFDIWLGNWWGMIQGDPSVFPSEFHFGERFPDAVPEEDKKKFYYISPFTLVEPHLSGTLAQAPNLEANEVLTLVKDSNYRRASVVNNEMNDYAVGVKWMGRWHNLGQVANAYTFMVCKRVRVTGDFPWSRMGDDPKGIESKELLFRLSVVAFQPKSHSEEGFRLMPTLFGFDEITEDEDGNEIIRYSSFKTEYADKVLQKVEKEVNWWIWDAESEMELINYYRIGGIVNWLNL